MEQQATPGQAAQPRLVDVHCHFVPRDFLESFDGFSLVPDDVWPEVLRYGERVLGPVIPRLFDAGVLREDMDRFGVDVRAICTASWLFCYWAEPELGERYARAMNDRLAAAAASSPDRLVALATVPLQDVDRAVAELRRAVGDLGMRGVTVGTNVNGRYFDDPSLFPFLEAAAELDVPVFFHPDNVAGEDRLQQYKLVQMLGNPHEATISLVRALLGGVLERLPTLKLVFPQAGGSLPTLLGRIDHAWHVREEAHANTPKPPSEYIKQCWFDSITHGPEPLESLLRHVSTDQVVLGSDYPWDMGEPVPAGSVRALDIDDTAKAKILGGNAAALLKL